MWKECITEIQLYCEKIKTQCRGSYEILNYHLAETKEQENKQNCGKPSAK